jgi:hypothetical protein
VAGAGVVRGGASTPPHYVGLRTLRHPPTSRSRSVVATHGAVQTRARSFAIDRAGVLLKHSPAVVLCVWEPFIGVMQHADRPVVVVPSPAGS